MFTTTTNHTSFENDARAEKNLWVAVLEQAIADAGALARRVKRDPGLWNDPLFRADAKSLTSYFQDQSMEFGGFGFICDLMETNPGKTYEKIEELYLRHLKPVLKQPTHMARVLAV